MSLTIFLHNKRPVIDIVRWFRDPKFVLNWAKSPIVTMSLSDFRTEGYDWVRQHFTDYETVRVSEDEATKDASLFREKTVKQVMDDSDVIGISAYREEWRFSPYVVRRNSFPRGMENLEPDKRRTIPANCGNDVFWKTFDEVYQFTHWYSI